MTEKRTVIFGGGTFSHIRPHLSLCAPAFGGTARRLKKLIPDADVVLTKMAGGHLVTNEDVSDFVDEMLLDDSVHVVYFNAALCDFEVDGIPTGLDAPRLESRGEPPNLQLKPTEKLIGKIRKTRKDIFLVGFKTTTGASEDVMKAKGLRLLKETSSNVVLVNDTHTMMNMIVVPEEAQYAVTDDRDKALEALVHMVNSRSKLTYVRTKVVSEDLVPWSEMPYNLRIVVEHCVKNGAYKPFRGKTSGHFAYHDRKTGVSYASRRKSNYNEDLSMIRCEAQPDGSVHVHGGKASVGAQTQRFIFEKLPVDYIVHFHCPLRENRHISFGDGKFPTREQFHFECGSLECATNTLSGMVDVWPGIWAVMLDQHGPNIAFPSTVDPHKVIEFIDYYFDLSAKTGGLVLDI